MQLPWNTSTFQLPRRAHSSFNPCKGTFGNTGLTRVPGGGSDRSRNLAWRPAYYLCPNIILSSLHSTFEHTH